jgi:heat shock protein HspQ
MTSLKKRVKNIVSYFINFIFLYRFRIFCNNAILSDILIVDIDNTIANTHENIKTLPPNKKKVDIKKLAPFNNVRKWIIEENSNCEIFYLSARNYWQYKDSKEWLRFNKFPYQNFGLAIVANPNQKIKYLDIAISKFRSVKYIDDLSFLDVQEKLCFYEKTIKQVKQMKLNYFDYNFIDKINSEENE